MLEPYANNEKCYANEIICYYALNIILNYNFTHPIHESRILQNQ